MAKKKDQAEESAPEAETAKKPAAAPAPAPATPKGVAAALPTRERIGTEPRRLSKGQRKHLRRQKQAGELKVMPRR